jgi:hypothetical protein
MCYMQILFQIKKPLGERLSIMKVGYEVHLKSLQVMALS